MYIRSLFEANKNVRDPRQQRAGLTIARLWELELTVEWQALFQEAEDLLEEWKHPDPYYAPTAPGGESLKRQLYAGVLFDPLCRI